MKLYRYSIKDRMGIIVHHGDKSWGEVAPFPGFSQETLEQALHQLKNPAPILYPSVAFGLEPAGIIKPMTLPLAALLSGTKEEIFLQARRFKREGYTHAKLKLSKLPLPDAYELVNTLKDQFRLRIDLNRSWETAQSIQFFAHFDYDAFEYIEEPVKEKEHLAFFTHPFALDETIRENPPEEFTHYPHLKAFIFKPTLHGGPSSLKKLIPLGIPIVLSSCFESGVGIFQIASLIQRLSLPIHPLGLGTYHLLDHDILETPLNFSNGKLELPSYVQPDLSRLHAADC